MRVLLSVALLLFVVAVALPRLGESVASTPTQPIAAVACVPPKTWVQPGEGATLDDASLFRSLAEHRVVLLGERHDSYAHHAWQLETLRRLHAQHGDLVIGMEMFPRRVQGVLDRWVAGELSTEQFLIDSDWFNVWSLDPDLYLDILHYAREHRIPLRALNVDRDFTRMVARLGLDAVPEPLREGVSRPHAPAPAYTTWLNDVFARHHDGDMGSEDDSRTRFIEAQLVWDRAMAEAIRSAQREMPGRLMVGLIGSGHLRHGWGVPHQLDALGEPDSAVLLPWDAGSPCSDLVPGLAEAVYGIEEALPVARPGLVVALDTVSRVVNRTLSAWWHPEPPASRLANDDITPVLPAPPTNPAEAHAPSPRASARTPPPSGSRLQMAAVRPYD